MKPKKSESTAKWLQQHYHLPTESGDISGVYNFHYTPYFLGVANALDDNDTAEVVLMKASQIGWTYFLLGYMAKRVYDASSGKQCPIMMLFAKEKDGKSFHDEKLVTTFPVNPALDGLIDVSTSRKSGNRWDFKKFDNGFLKIVGSNSPGNVKSTSSVGVGIVEEPDDTSENVKEQGDSIGLLEERLKRYENSRLIVGGTPAIKGLSRTEQRLKETDCRVLPIRCHACGKKHVLSFEHVSWEGKNLTLQNQGEQPVLVDGETGEIIKQQDIDSVHEIYGYSKPETAVYICPHCQTPWDDYQRQENIRNTVSEAIENNDPMAGWEATRPFHGKAGFMQLGEVYSCLPGGGLAELVKDYLSSEYYARRGDMTKKIKFTNQKLGQAYEYSENQIDLDTLREAALDYPEKHIPDGGLLLTAGVDIQHNRIAIVLRAWGRDKRSWNIYFGEIYAKNSTVNEKDPVWDELENILYSAYPSAYGWSMLLSAVSIDASDGSTSDAVYSFVRKMRRKHPQILTMAIKGSSNNTDPEIFSTPKSKSIDHTNPKKQTKADRHGVKIYLVGTNKAKDFIHNQLELIQSGLGRWHYYEGIRGDYFEQITGEVKAPHRSNAFRKTWQQKAGQPVEALDCEVYALHAAWAVKVHLKTEKQWLELEQRYRQPDLFNNLEASGDTPPPPPKPKKDKPANGLKPEVSLL